MVQESRSRCTLLLVLALILAGCGSAPTPSADQAAPTIAQPATRVPGILKVGILGPFSGPSESTGHEFRGAAIMAFEAINWRIGTYQIEPVWIDSRSDPEVAARAYEQAIVRDGIQAGILNWHSSVATECMEVAARYKIPHIFAYGATETINETFWSDPEKYSYWMNKGWPTPSKLTIGYVQAIENAIAQGAWAPQNKTVAICGENTHWGRSFGQAIKEQLTAEGWETVVEEYFNLDEVQFHAMLAELKAKDVALVAATSTSMPSFAALINQAQEVGLESMFIADGLGWSGDWYAMTGGASNYVLDQIPGWATAEGQAFADAFQARWGVAPSPSAAGLAYDGTNLFIQVAEQALTKYGELSSDTIYRWARENLQTGDWSYTDGIVMEEYKYTADSLPDPVVGEGYYLFPVRQYFDGIGKIIYPPEWAEATLQARPGPAAAGQH